MPEYESWKEGLQGGEATGWEIKYYKGLGTSSPKEAKEYFAAMDYHKKNFVWEGKRLMMSFCFLADCCLEIKCYVGQSI